MCTRCTRISTEMCPATPDYARGLVSNSTCTSVHTMQAHLNCNVSSDTRLCTRSRLEWIRKHATVHVLNQHMHKCEHDASASQLPCVERHSTLHEISYRLDTAACNCTCTKTAHAQVCTRCKRISTDMCPATPDFARDLVSAGHGCMQLHLH